MEGKYTTEQMLEAVRAEASAYGRGLGGFHCPACGQKTFRMLWGVQQVLGISKGLGATSEDEHKEATRLAILRNAAPELVEALRFVVSCEANQDIQAAKDRLFDLAPDIRHKVKVALAKAGVE